MATVLTLTQSQPALLGNATPFVLSVLNTGGSNITLQAACLVVTDAAGRPSTACAVAPVGVPPELGTAQVGGSQLNITIAPSGTQYLTFGACFFGPAIVGVPAQPNNQFLVSATVLTSDGSFSTGGQAVNLSTPVNGVLGSGSPPNPALVVGALQFFNPFDAVLAL